MLAMQITPAGAKAPARAVWALRFSALRPLPPTTVVAVPFVAQFQFRIAQQRWLSRSSRQMYNYDPNSFRQQQQRWQEEQQKQQQRWEQYQQHQRQGQEPQARFKGVPVLAGDMPPEATFEDSGFHRRGSFFKRAMYSTSMQTVMVVAAVAALLFYFSHMELVPVSGRRRFNCFSEDSMKMLGDMQYEQLMQEARAQSQRFLPAYDPRTLVVRNVMSRLIPVSGMSDNPGDWEIVVIDDPSTVNAFVLPGGKVFVYSGIFAVARNEDAIAAVLGHELAHNLANHHGERASSAVGTTMLLASAFVLTAGLSYFILQPVVELVFNTPMSRLQESEADLIGLMLMAEACFDPSQAVEFWRRMDQAQKVQPPEWISTHPSVGIVEAPNMESNQHRMEKIQEWMPAAMEKRSQSSCDGTRDFAERFKRALRNGMILAS
ncbi:peptidase [Sporothrix schenckii 1099-18]|uniref:Peptidase n=1 Tax=Sporothrix schenckii 1099-18 TaxID=1397361 RepID=A0A0F2M2G9_SPOSC|nr:peptidase [Sporothrix schenckii 1099-18]KJR82930.1 peptidase [Sporothrix schenckii 1099-18]